MFIIYFHKLYQIHNFIKVIARHVLVDIFKRNQHIRLFYISYASTCVVINRALPRDPADFLAPNCNFYQKIYPSD